MEKVVDQKHNKYTFIYALSTLFERGAYYGLRALIVIYMISEVINMSNIEALGLFGWITFSITFSRIIGALIGDLIIGNKKALISGAVLQFIGALTLCSNSIIGLYIGLGLLVLGSGFYSPNMTSHYGKLYLNKTKLLDAAFTIFYLAINLGSFIGMMTIPIIGEKYGWNYGFLAASLFFLASICLPLIFKDDNVVRYDDRSITKNKTYIKVIVSVLLVACFWGINQISYTKLFHLQLGLRDLNLLGITNSFWESINSFFELPISVLFIFIWSYFYNNQFTKIIIGFIFATLSLAVLFFIPEITNEKQAILFLFSILLFSIAEVHISPIINSVLTKYINPKYLAIAISLAFIPTGLIYYLVNVFSDPLYEDAALALQLGILSYGVLSIGLIAFIINKKRAKTLH